MGTRWACNLMTLCYLGFGASNPGVSDDTGVKMAGSDIVGKNDLLIVGPGVLGRLVAEKWQEVLLSDCPIVILYLSYLPCVSYWFKLRKPYSSFIVWSIIFFFGSKWRIYFCCFCNTRIFNI